MTIEGGSPDDRLAAILEAATQTAGLVVDHGALAQVGAVFRAHFPGAGCVLVADPNTYDAAGQQTQRVLRSEGVTAAEPCVIADPDLWAEYRFVDSVTEQLAEVDAIPIAVGSGTVNDLVKLSAHRCGRPYLCVATAASMDGYTAWGASITKGGSKQTFYCPAPRVLVADLDVLCQAPVELNSSGYGDLLGKVTAGADWIAADLLGYEPIDPAAWSMVQGELREAIADPAGVRGADPAAIRRLTTELLVSGFAMQAHESSRPASGSEHQFSHLWDMQHHTHRGQAPSHGMKVGVGSVASARLYEALLAEDLVGLDIDAICASWPAQDRAVADARAAFPIPELGAKAAEEVGAKYETAAELRIRLGALVDRWPTLRARLGAQLLPSSELERMLDAAGCSGRPEQIGIDPERMRRSYGEARLIRRRFTVLDLAWMTGRFDRLVDAACGRRGS